MLFGCLLVMLRMLSGPRKLLLDVPPQDVWPPKVIAGCLLVMLHMLSGPRKIVSVENVEREHWWFQFIVLMLGATSVAQHIWHLGCFIIFYIIFYVFYYYLICIHTIYLFLFFIFTIYLFLFFIFIFISPPYLTSMTVDGGEDSTMFNIDNCLWRGMIIVEASHIKHYHFS